MKRDVVLFTYPGRSGRLYRFPRVVEEGEGAPELIRTTEKIFGKPESATVYRDVDLSSDSDRQRLGLEKAQR